MSIRTGDAATKNGNHTVMQTGRSQQRIVSMQPHRGAHLAHAALDRWSDDPEAECCF